MKKSASRFVLSYLLVFAACLLAAAPSRAALGPPLGDDRMPFTSEGDDTASVPPLTPAEAAHLAEFKTPSYTAAQVSEILAAYDNVDPGHVIPRALRDQAITYFEANKDHIDNKRYLSVVDFSTRSSTARFFIIDMETGKVQALHVAHGKGSDPDNTGLPTHFSNTPESKMSSLGFYRTAETYEGNHGLALRMDGLSPTNSNVRDRAIVIHGAEYVEDKDVKAGRSWGCFAFSMDMYVKVVNGLKGGSIILAALEK